MSKKIKILTLTLVLVVSLVLSFSAGCALGTTVLPRTELLGREVTTEAWDLIFRDYVDKGKLDASALSQGAIKGMVKALADPYTSYLSPQHYQMSMSDLAGKFEGIGASVEVKGEQLTVIAPMAGSPAEKMGIKPGDIILAIDGKSTSGMSLEEAVSQIRGPKGTPVRLQVLHQGEIKPVEIEVVRAEVTISTVRFEMREDIAYIKITDFAEHTDEELSGALKNVVQGGATGIILDLRHNPGGLLETVIDVAGYFLKDGVVTYVVDNKGKQTPYSVKPRPEATELPLVVLTDNFSASASEVLAGALQDHGRATIAGTKTYGKGSVNTVYRLKDGSGLWLTTARWLTPDGRLIEGKGIIPDYTLELEGEAAVQWAIDYLKGGRVKSVT